MSEILGTCDQEQEAGNAQDENQGKERKKARAKAALKRLRQMVKEWDKDVPDPEERMRIQTDHVLRRYVEMCLADPAVRA